MQLLIVILLENALDNDLLSQSEFMLDDYTRTLPFFSLNVESLVTIKGALIHFRSSYLNQWLFMVERVRGKSVELGCDQKMLDSISATFKRFSRELAITKFVQ